MELIMSKLLSMLILSVAVSAASVCAAEQSPLYVIKSVNVNASADAVWEKIAKFGDLGAWHPAVAKTEITNGSDGKVGAKRLLTLQDGGQIKETLTAYNQKNKTMSYVITDGVLPVSQYASSLHVYPNGEGKAVVVWESSFNPKAPNDERVASDTINAVYDAGLNNLKKIVE